MLKLTDYETGEPVNVKLDWIVSTRSLPAEEDGSPRGLTTRTRIDTKSDTVIVRETLPFDRSLYATAEEILLSKPDERQAP